MGKNITEPRAEEELNKEAYDSLKAEAEAAKVADAENRAAAMVSEATRPFQERIASLELEIKARDEAILKGKTARQET